MIHLYSLFYIYIYIIHYTPVRVLNNYTYECVNNVPGIERT